MDEIVAGTLEVGTTGDGEVVINHPDLKPDADGVGHIVFSPAQARGLGDLLLRKAEDALMEQAPAVRAAFTSGDVHGVLKKGRHLGAPPKHAFEVTIKIGGDYWEYVLRAVRELACHLEEHGPDCKMMGAGAGGCHHVDVLTRDVAPGDYHLELMAWAGHA
jgi:hypothetical protein